jgi:hypothetical protein
MQSVRIIEIPKCIMVSSGTGMFGQEKFGRFFKWFTNLPKSIYPKDFLFWDGVGLYWLYLYDKSLEVPSEFEIIDFEGGLYSVATDIDQQTDMDAMKIEVDKFLDENGLERDNNRFELGNIITSPLANEVLGYNQMDYYTPVKSK